MKWKEKEREKEGTHDYKGKFDAKGQINWGSFNPQTYTSHINKRLFVFVNKKTNEENDKLL